jgi:hypothetical protein
MEYWVSGWTAPKQEVTEEVRESWMWEFGKDECVRTDAGPEAAYWRGMEFSRMGGYNFPGQIVAIDGSESNGAMGAGLIVLGNSEVTGSIRVGQSILWEISRWVVEGSRTFLVLSANPDILRMVIGRLCMRIE